MAMTTVAEAMTTKAAAAASRLISTLESPPNFKIIQRPSKLRSSPLNLERFHNKNNSLSQLYSTKSLAKYAPNSPTCAKAGGRRMVIMSWKREGEGGAARARSHWLRKKIGPRFFIASRRRTIGRRLHGCQRSLL